VTHLPQLAAYGDLHFSVRKSVHEGRTTTQVQALEEEERLTELALMLGGVNPANLAAARETRLSAQQRMQELAVKI
jgi:DNA repair protein RecN (Recombination protein N)